MTLCGKDHEKLIKRINRIEGQVHGLGKMIESKRDCFDVLKQIAAVSGAVKSLGAVILENHLRGCVSDSMRGKRTDEDLISQVIYTFNKFNK